MSLLNSVLGGLLGGQAQQSPVGGILASLMGGEGQGGQQGTPQGAAPGLMGLVGQLQQGGLGSAVQSWMSNGPNQSVTPQQLHQAFGDQQVNQWAQQTNMQPHDLLGQLAQLLPQVVDRLTPQGQAPGQGAGQAGGIADGMQGEDPFSGAGVETT